VKYDYNASGLIDKEKFARSYAHKIMRDHIDGKRSPFLPFEMTLTAQPFRFDLSSRIRELQICDGHSQITLGVYFPRGALQRHRFTLWMLPSAITRFFDLGFEDYVALYEIKDGHTETLAKLRWW